ncbi:MAG: hypothetical protein J6A88_06105 [Oscillospiraceae bacterium]|nr:hypothetical protein [Oscillospiraceae bacterium]
MISEAAINKAREQFELAAEDFGFVFHSPFALTDNLSVFGYIENYGSKNGVVVCLTSPLDFSTNQEVHEVINWCKQMECFCSFISIEPLLREYKTSYFREMLRDWGKY